MHCRLHNFAEVVCSHTATWHTAWKVTSETTALEEAFGEVRNINRFAFCAALYVFVNAQIMHAHWLPNAPSLHHEIYIKVHKDQTLANHLHIHTNRLRDRLEWYSYNQNYIVNKSLQQLLNIHSVVRGEPISTVVWQLKVRRPLRHCVFFGCLRWNVRNKSHSTCRKWQSWFQKAVKYEKIIHDAMQQRAACFRSLGLELCSVTQRCRADDQSSFF